MPLYAYTAIDSAGRTVRSTIEADNEQLVLAKLRDQSLHCTDIKRSKQKSGLANKSFGKKKFKLKSLVVFSRQFATMIDAGIPMLRCLDILTEQTKDPTLKEALEQITIDVKGGLTLTDSLAKHPVVFSKLYVNMIRAAENCGWLLEYPRQALAGGSMYAFHLPSPIPRAGAAGGPPLPEAQKALFAFGGKGQPGFREMMVEIDHTPSELGPTVQRQMAAYQRQKQQHK